MCGINGMALAGAEPCEARIVARMNAALQHRGPDEGGLLDLGWSVLGMRRLSIVDLAHGQQPMQSADRRLALVYNGELYDVGPLRERLRRMGYEFGSHSDTEVLLNALHAWERAALGHLNGMYGFAAADAQTRTLLLARDPLGIKPLYYWHGPRGELVFSSELKSLLAHPLVPRELDRDALAQLLVDRYVADPWTLLRGVRALPPGHWLVWRDGRIELGRHARFELEPREQDEGLALAELREALGQSVRAQLEADVPVGVFLSGGIDSSTVAAFAARALRAHGSAEPLRSFSIGFARADYDESALARRVARHLGTQHAELRIEDARFEPADLDRVLDHAGQPLGDVSCVPTYAVSKLASEHVKVVLSGDGGDELFGGYDHLRWAAAVRRASERVPAPLRRVGALALAGTAPLVSGRAAERVRRARKGLDLSLQPAAQQFRRMRALWTPEQAARLLGHQGALALRPQTLPDALLSAELEPEQHAMSVLTQTYLPGAILAKVDRMSMAASLEVRVPLLDRRVVELARRLPLEFKLRGGVGKHLLRESARAWLPAEVYSHKKQGFALPLASWLTPAFHELGADLFARGSRAASLFARPELERALGEARAAGARPGQRSDQSSASRAWLLVQLARWIERFEVRT